MNTVPRSFAVMNTYLFPNIGRYNNIITKPNHIYKFALIRTRIRTQIILCLSRPPHTKRSLTYDRFICITII